MENEEGRKEVKRKSKMWSEKERREKAGEEDTALWH